MAELKCEQQTIITTEYDDLEEFIKDVTGHTYEILPNEECSNDSSLRMTVSADLDQHSKMEWNQFKKTGIERGFLLRTILDGLCSDGHIQPGEYLVNVSW